MVPPASGQVALAWTYSGCAAARGGAFAYRALTFFGPAFQRVRLAPPFGAPGHAGPGCALPRPRGGNACTLVRAPRFGLLRVRSPLLAQSRLISFPPGTEMFQFPGSAATCPMCSGTGPPGMAPAGFPHSEICGSRAVCASPQLIAACHVLHRLCVPRHPPWALSIFFSLHMYTAGAGRTPRRVAIVSAHEVALGEGLAPLPRYGEFHVIVTDRKNRSCLALCKCQGALGGARLRPSALETGCRDMWSQCPACFDLLPRKEVIQPHLPVRLPCYDFTPLTPRTFDASAPQGFGRRLRVQTTRVV